MAYRKLNSNERLEIGDIVRTAHNLGGVHNYPITRLTTKFAFSKRQDGYETKFPAIFDLYFQRLPREKYNTTNHEVYRKVIVNA